MSAAGVRYPPRPTPQPIPLHPARPVAPTVAGQLLPSRSLRALKCVLDRQRSSAA